ncbi:Uncharacterised protein [Gordonia paraffinivorans]|uniref:Uncharacterized protein n=1 Tax=Gordonia paraffinivorans TaxID=175628 RepID=A0ABD7V1X4_9ACTN|nr:hypothetical protein [Gordonia paraffinivorans]VFA88402.1 Uncharacterised protein [Gordonia paraffinivorans]
MTDHPEPELVEQIPAADWTDMDLLTRDGAGELLDSEIEAERARVEELRGAGDDARLAEAETRLNRMVEIRSSLTADRSGS